MQFPQGATVVRLRAGVEVDEYSTEEKRTDWENPDELTIEDAFVASGSSSSSSGTLRETVTTTKSLYLSDPDADVLVGDRIRDGATVYDVETKPEADRNPFTGWQPVREIPLTERSG